MSNIFFKKNILNYLLIFFLIANSGFPYFYYHIEWIIISTLLGLYVALLRNIKIKRIFISTVFICLLIHVAQMTSSGVLIPLKSFIGFYLRIFNAYLTVMLIGPLLPKFYIKILYTFTLISFVFFFPSILFPNFSDFVVSNIGENIYYPFHSERFSSLAKDNIIIFEYDGIQSMRNSGPFWEAGAFGGYLIIALLFNLIVNRTIFNKYGIIFIIGILTTQSTTIFIALFMLLLFHNIFYSKQKKKVFYLPLIIIIMLWAFFNLNFMNSKIQNHLDKSEIDMNSQSRTRFGSFVLDFKDFLDNPIWGNGKDAEVRYGSQIKFINIHKNNGVSSVLAQYGIIFFFFYYLFIYRTFTQLSLFYNNSKKIGIISIILIATIAFSETYFQYVFFYGLAFLHASISPIRNNFIEGEITTEENGFVNYFK